MLRKRTSKPAPKVRELFIEELGEIRGGSASTQAQRDPCCTTMACCEEGPLGGCCPIIIIEP
jgi:hypothetical protein